MKNYVIIGNGIAAAGCIEGIRSTDSEGSITVISGEKYPAYCRPLISYYLEGKSKLKNMPCRPEGFYESNGCRVIYGAMAEKIDTENKTVSFSPQESADSEETDCCIKAEGCADEGGALPYDALCICTGSRPFVPPMEGLESVEKCFSFLTLDDTLALEKAIDRESRVLIIGAGLIGLKCAEGIADRVKSVCVCDLAPHVLSSILDEETAPAVEEHLRACGVELLLSDSAVRLERNKAFMKSGKTAEFDVLVIAVGVRANSELARDAGADTGRGITVGTDCRTSIDDIYSAGDCAEGFDSSTGKNRILALLPNAYMQGFTAGVNMAGGSKTLDNSIPMNSLGLFGMHIMTAGFYAPESEGGSVMTVKDGSGTRKFFIKDGRLSGYIFEGKVENGGIFTALIREKTPLESIDFELLAKSSSFGAFSEETRRHKFGGVV